MLTKNLIVIPLYFMLVLFASQSNATELTPRKLSLNNGCNFFITDLCLELSAGDELKIKSQADFILYDILLASGLKITIYTGFNPNAEPYTEGKQKRCKGKECYLSFERENGYILYKEAKKIRPRYVHILFSKITSENKPSLDEFLNSVKACKRGDKIVCEKSSPFLI